jgi:hypothetical protein
VISFACSSVFAMLSAMWWSQRPSLEAKLIGLPDLGLPTSKAVTK